MSDEGRYTPKSSTARGPLTGDNRGPREREASKPPAPPLPCPGGCGLNLALDSHTEASTCTYAPQWRSPAVELEVSAPEPPAPSGPTAPAVGNVVNLRRNGYRWPFSKKANGSR